MTADKTTPATLTEAYDWQYRRRVAATAQRLRDLADDFEQHALNVRTEQWDPGHGIYFGGPYSAAADRAIDTVTAGLANAKPGSIVGEAASADRAFIAERTS